MDGHTEMAKQYRFLNAQECWGVTKSNIDSVWVTLLFFVHLFTTASVSVEWDDNFYLLTSCEQPLLQVIIHEHSH